MTYPATVRMVEVGPRDGLQNEPGIVPVSVKVRLIEDLAGAGLKAVETGSFVSPKWVPQMADTAEVLGRVKRLPGVSYPVLVPNLKGLDSAMAAHVDEIAVFASASETFSQKNINCSIRDSLTRLGAVVGAALSSRMKVRAYVSCALGCPYEGQVDAHAAADVAAELFGMGCYEISLGDTIGVGTPLKAQRMIAAVAERVPIHTLAVHYHDTWGQALANILASLELGVAVIDSSVAGLGGCPYAPGAAGNVATEDVLYMLDGMGIQTGVNLERLAAAGRAICRELNRQPASKAASAFAASLRNRQTPAHR
jgi:hydroxymethylglutaryl-CoA lyase